MSVHDTLSPPHGLEQRVYESLATGVLLFDRDLRLLTLNPAAEALLEISANQVRGMEIRQLLPGADTYIHIAEQAVRDGNSLTERDMALKLPAGRVLRVDCTVTPINEPAPDSGLLTELVDVDRHKRIARDERLISQRETARALVRGLAHEIRNPLGGLRGAAQLLERAVADPELTEYTNVIIAEADRLQNLLDRMLGPRARPEKRLLNVHEVTERVRTLIEAESPPGIRVERDYDPSIPRIRADRELMIQALLNVARNAVQALGETGSILLRTRIRRQFAIGSRLHRLVVQIDVRDDGPGVAPELIERVFYPMVTGRADGTGLGLSIAQALVSQHDGLIECASQPGETTFAVLLPVEEGA